MLPGTETTEQTVIEEGQAATSPADNPSPAGETPHWLDVPEDRARFWGLTKDMAELAGANDYKAFAHQALGGVKSTREFKAGLDQALLAVLKLAIRTLLSQAYPSDKITERLISSILRAKFGAALANLGYIGILEKIQAHVDEDDSAATDPKSRGRRRSVRLHDKDYMLVEARIAEFRQKHPDWSLETDPLTLDDQKAIFRAVVKDPAGRILAVGHACSTIAAARHLSGRFIEKAETAAVGRCLAHLGFGNTLLDPSGEPPDTRR